MLVGHQMKYKTEPSIDKLIDKLRHGGGALSPIKGLSPCQIHVLVAGLLGVGMGVAGLVMALRESNVGIFRLPWTSEQRASPEVLWFVAGLQNLGNNCFLNVILQRMLDADESETGEIAERMPLTVALVSLLEELCIIRDERIVLSPRRVMLAMGLYVSSFNLTRQQDAAEAFMHLLSSLEAELSQSYIPHCSSLVDVSSFPCKITSSEREIQSECRRWQQQFFGQFDGTLGSMLFCRSCSSQLSIDFEFFHCLPLSPVLDRNANMMDSCTLADCLKKFTTAEHLENYRCGRCSHISALKYLSLKAEENEAIIQKLSRCIKLDSCDCKNLFTRGGVAWPMGFSCASKQLMVARHPKILCIHLQRAFMGISGELIKLQGHIFFPLLLDLFPFTSAAMDMGRGASEEDISKPVGRQQQPSVFQSNHFSTSWKMQLAPNICSLMGGVLSSEALVRNKLGRSASISSDDTSTQTRSGSYSKYTVTKGKMVSSDFSHPQICPVSECRVVQCNECSQCDEKINISGGCVPSKSYIYRLASVVEHYGTYGGGHYAVYRRLVVEPDAKHSAVKLKSVDPNWVYISDHKVSSV